MKQNLRIYSQLVVAKAIAFVLLSSLTIPVFAQALDVSPRQSSSERSVVVSEKKSIVEPSKGEVRYIVQFRESNTEQTPTVAQRKARINTIIDRTRKVSPDIRAAREYNNIPMTVVIARPESIENLRKDPDVVAVEADVLHTASLLETIPQIDADFAHMSGVRGLGQAVAVLDTGVDKTHPFVSVISEACYSNAGGVGVGVSTCPSGAPVQIGSGSGVPCLGSASCAHGTHVAGIVGGTSIGSVNGTIGVAPQAKIIAIQVFTRMGSNVSAYTSDIIAGLDRVLDLKNDPTFTTPIAAVNMSLGGGLYSSQSACDAAYSATKNAIDALRAAGIATIIASGNDGSVLGIAGPGCISTAFAVGAVNDNDWIPMFSNSNSMVDLLAPGVNVVSSVPGGGFASYSGTSMATPHVAGAWALARSAKPSATIDQIYNAFKSTGKSVTDWGNLVVRPRIDIDNALTALGVVLPGFAPTNISLSKSTVVQNKNIGTTVGTITVIDPDSASHVVALLCTTKGVDDAHFAVSGTKLVTAKKFSFAAPIDANLDNKYEICLRATDTSGNKFDKNFTITVTKK